MSKRRSCLLMVSVFLLVVSCLSFPALGKPLAYSSTRVSQKASQYQNLKRQAAKATGQEKIRLLESAVRAAPTYKQKSKDYAALAVAYDQAHQAARAHVARALSKKWARLK